MANSNKIHKINLLLMVKMEISRVLQRFVKLPGSVNTYLMGSITVQMTCLFYLDSAAMLMLNDQQFYLFGQMLTSVTRDLPYSDTFHYGECSLYGPMSISFNRTSFLHCRCSRLPDQRRPRHQERRHRQGLQQPSVRGLVRPQSSRPRCQ